MTKRLSHYVRRSLELGFWNTLKRMKVRGSYLLTTRIQSIWWSWKARRKMSDAKLLSRTTGKWSSIDSLFDHLAARSASSFLLPHDSPDETARLLYQHYPEHISSVLAEADAACRNEVSLLGKIFHFPTGIDWQKDPVTDYQWPLLHASRMAESLWDPDRPADIRYVWELNRHQHFISLGIAYWLTGEKKYVDAFNSQLRSWHQTNPLQHGLNWYSSLELSLRLIAWTIAFQFFRSSPDFREETGKLFLESLWQQAEYISNHLQTKYKDDFPNNHIIGELAGLVLVGTIFPEFRKATIWRDTGLRLLAQQVVAQTHPDGVNKEQATGYHRFVTEFLLLIVTASHRGLIPRQMVLEQTLEKMLDYVAFSLAPDGSAPMWGDADFGRVLGLGKNKDFWDFRPSLSVGTLLFICSTWKFAAGHLDEEAFWLLGPDSINCWGQVNLDISRQSSKAYPDAGHYIIRDNWSFDSDIAYFRCGPFGLGGEGHAAHAHCDLLSFTLWVNGLPLLVDPGTYTYHGSWRDYFRLTAAHNTVMIDGQEQAKPLPYFKWEQIPEAASVEWTGKSITGALVQPSQVRFVRKLSHVQKGVWELVDTFSGPADHSLDWFFHFAPGLTLQLDPEKQRILILKDQQSFLIMHTPDVTISSEVQSTWYSNRYNVKEEIQSLRVAWQGKLDDLGISFPWRFQLVNNDFHKKGKGEQQ